MEDIALEMKKHRSELPPKPNNKKAQAMRGQLALMTQKLNETKDQIYDQKINSKKLDKRIMHLIRKAQQYEGALKGINQENDELRATLVNTFLQSHN